jgi:hypothetical protein
VQCGPAIVVVKSTTRTPLRALLVLAVIAGEAKQSGADRSGIEIASSRRSSQRQ